MAAAAGEANQVSFEGVLAAQLAQLAGIAPDADSVPSAGSDPSKAAAIEKDQNKDQNKDQEASARLASSVQTSLQVAIPVPAPQRPVATVAPETATSTGTATLSAAPRRLDAVVSGPSPAPKPGEQNLQQATPIGKPAPAADGAPGLPESARIAAPAAATVAQPAPSTPAVQLAEVQPSAATHPSDPRDQRSDPATVVIAAPPERAESVSRNLSQPVQLNVAAPMGSSGFAPEVGDRLVWMATNNHQVAALRIDPPQLGPVEVHLSISNDQANLSIVSPHAAVREALQASLPRLHDMLQGLGISLGSVSVGAEAFGHGGSGQSGLGAEASGYAWPMQTSALGDDPPVAATGGFVTLRSGSGVIDVYA